MSTWRDYNKNTENRPANTLALEGLLFVDKREKALDLGCGAMRDTKAIIEAGFKHIDAVDSNADIAEIAKNIPEVTFYPVQFHEFDFPKDAYDFLNAQNAIPFAGPEHFEELWNKIENSINNLGVFSGTFFGVKDEWAAERSNLSFVTKERVVEMLDSKTWNVKKLDEFYGPGKKANGDDKMWHVFSVIATRMR